MSARVRVLASIAIFILPTMVAAKAEKIDGGSCEIHPELEWAMKSSSSLSEAIGRYQQTYGTFPESVQMLGKPEKGSQASSNRANLADEKLLKPEKHGYEFRYEKSADGWRLWITAQKAKRQCGSLFTDQTGILRIHLKEGEAPASVDAKAKRVRVEGEVMKKRLTAGTQPSYPEEAKRMMVTGVVKLKAVINVDGEIIDLIVVSGQPVLLRAVLEAIQGWRYVPTTVQKIPVEVETIIETNFSMDR